MASPQKKQADKAANTVNEKLIFMYLIWQDAGSPIPNWNRIGEKLGIKSSAASMRFVRLRKELDAAGFPVAKEGGTTTANDNQDAAATDTPKKGRKRAAGTTPKKTPAKGGKRKASEEAAEDKTGPTEKKVKVEEGTFEDMFGEDVIDDSFGNFQF